MAADGAGSAKLGGARVPLVDARILDAWISRRPPLIPVERQHPEAKQDTETPSQRHCDWSDRDDFGLDEFVGRDAQEEPEVPKGPSAGGDFALTSKRLLFHTQLGSTAGGRPPPRADLAQHRAVSRLVSASGELTVACSKAAYSLSVRSWCAAAVDAMVASKCSYDRPCDKLSKGSFVRMWRGHPATPLRVSSAARPWVECSRTGPSQEAPRAKASNPLSSFRSLLQSPAAFGDVGGDHLSRILRCFVTCGCFGTSPQNHTVGPSKSESPAPRLPPASPPLTATRSSF